MMSLLVLAIAPGIALAWYVYNKDRLEREPLRLLILSFTLGVLVVFPAGLIELIIEFLTIFNKKNLISLALYCFFGIGLIEEGAKFLVIYKYIYPREEFNTPFDGIVYSSMVGLGFATIENIGYVIMGGIETAIFRAFLAVPAHFLFSLIMGYSLGLAKFTYNFPTHILNALLYPSIIHALYDFLILSQIWWLTILIIPLVYILLRKYWKQSKKLL
ncbi:MAG: PrsW family glutamic-type intramembrane protease [Dictyoglomaceae bacterium]|nr:PrsW family glutamic-type intramembrane protease [Dictyoglomaceae bacterium]